MSEGEEGQSKQQTPDLSGSWNHTKSENVSEFLAANGKILVRLYGYRHGRQKYLPVMTSIHLLAGPGQK